MNKSDANKFLMENPEYEFYRNHLKEVDSTNNVKFKIMKTNGTKNNLSIYDKTDRPFLDFIKVERVVQVSGLSYRFGNLSQYVDDDLLYYLCNHISNNFCIINNTSNFHRYDIASDIIAKGEVNILSANDEFGWKLRRLDDKTREKFLDLLDKINMLGSPSKYGLILLDDVTDYVMKALIRLLLVLIIL